MGAGGSVEGGAGGRGGVHPRERAWAVDARRRGVGGDPGVSVLKRGRGASFSCLSCGVRVLMGAQLTSLLTMVSAYAVDILLARSAEALSATKCVPSSPLRCALSADYGTLVE